MKRITLFLFAILFAQTIFAFKNELTSICKRPGSNELYIAGEFKTILIVDVHTKKSLRTIKTDGIVKDFQFSPDGQNLLVYTGNTVNFLNPETGEITRSIKGNNVRLFEKSPYFIDADRYMSKSIKVYSTNDASLIFEHKPNFPILDAGFNADFSELLILGDGMDIKKEKSLIRTETTPVSGYNVYNKAYVEQQKDNKGSGFQVVDLKTKNLLLDVVIPYKTAKSFGLSVSKYKDAYFIACWDMFLKIDNKGMASPLENSDATFAYAANHTNDGQYIYVASSKSGYIYNSETAQFTPFNLKTGSESSYTADISELNDTVYHLAKDYSVAMMDKTGKILSKFEVTNDTGNGFGVYYYNGFTKKEARDKEALIINNNLEALGMEKIDLETAIGKSDFLLGVFKTKDDAEKFMEALKKNGLEYLIESAPIE